MSAPKRTFEKIKLQLRTTPIEKEIARQKFPKDLAERLRIFEGRNETIMSEMYDMVLDFIDLSTRFEFWKEDGSGTLVEWLAKRNMPCGATLADREVLVRLFDKNTFVKAGHNALGEMTFLVTKYQPDSDLRRRDYEAIFDAYMKSNDAFDKKEFRRILNWYINTTYIEPSARPKGDNTARPPKSEPKGASSKREVRPINEDEPNGEKDYHIEPVLCGGCRVRDEYIAALEAVITSELGAKRLPKRPQGI